MAREKRSQNLHSFLCGDEMKELLCCPDPGGLGSARFAVGLSDLKSLWQPKQLCDSITMPGGSVSGLCPSLLHWAKPELRSRNVLANK